MHGDIEPRPLETPEPRRAVAIVGLSCRLPSANGPEELWRLLAEGASGISAPAVEPADGELAYGESADGELTEGAESAGRRGALPGGFLDRIDEFDAAFFGISPREAVEMDPQQRLMLELGWEALEDAAILPGALRDTRTGVFVGAFADDYATLLARSGRPYTQHSLTGTSRGIIANRISYTLGLRGPSMTVDAAQASSLVAVHLACESLRKGESTLALAGGVNLIADPESTARTVEFGALSPDGRCYTFDARANGYVRGEGGGFVVLKPLDRALADGDPVYAVIRGGAVNNDGATDGLTVPRAESQAEVVRAACAHAGVDPHAVQYVELHGTGTRVGDPVEAAALGAALGDGRPDASELVVGSAKTNVGHLEGAAGIVGLLKTALAIRHRRIPASLNFATPHPDIPLEALNLRVQTAPGPWPYEDRPLLAGISSFGMGGTNCHLVLAEPDSVPAPVRDPGRAVDRPARVDAPGARPWPWLVSGRDAAALSAQAARLRAHLEGHPDLSPVDVGWSLATTRSTFAERAVVVGRDRRSLLDGLAALERGDAAAGLVRGRRSGTDAAGSGGLTALFTGQGSQFAGMGREAYGSFPRFAAEFDAVCDALDAHLDGHVGRPLREVVFADEGTPEAGLLSQTAYTQAALFALETALYRLFEHWGLRPDALAGHSIGELTAAHVAGVLSLDDAAKLVAARGRLMQALPVAGASSGGAMASLEASEGEVLEALAVRGGQLGVAAVNGPESVVVSGAEDAVLELLSEWRRRGRKAKRLRVSHAFHSPLMDPMLADFERVARELSYAPPRVPVISNVTGAVAAAEELCSPAYWVRHVRSTVRFQDAVRTAWERGTTAFLEVGPGGVLTGMAEDCVAAAADTGAEPVLVPTLLPGRPEPEALFTALARLHVRGTHVGWDAVYGEQAPRTVPLPRYAFQRQSFWPSAAELAPGGRPSAEPLPAEPDTSEESSAGGGTTWATRLAGRPAAEQRDELLELVRTHVAIVLGHVTPDTVDTGLAFKDLGFESASAVELRNRLNEATGLRLPPSLTYNHPTPAALVSYLLTELGDEAGSPGAGEPGPAAGERARGPLHADEPIAVVGMACRYPGGVTAPADLWRLVTDEGDAIGPFPANRDWDVDGLYDPDPETPGTSYAREGGFLYDADEFDPAFFGISPREALAMDPQQRLLLETAWEAFERAGIAPETLRGERAGVFVGATTQDYGPRLHEAPEGLDGYLLTGNTVSVVSGRVAYTFGLEGPAVTVDTACSSSLVALHLAAQALRGGECDMALAGGVNVMAGPGMFTEFSRQRGLAANGRCKAFAGAADGTGWGEGVGMLLVERLSDARRRGHPVLAVVRGSAVNQDGASNGLAAPNGLSQQRVIRQALTNARLTAADVDAVEAHGTGTSLGDPIEAEALLATYGQERAADRPLWLGSVKSNIGHAQAAAGVAGVIKMVEAMRHGQLPRTLHVDEPSPHVDWDAGAVSLLTEPVAWPEADRPRRAAVSSFGISGTNAHVILEAAAPTEAVEPPVEPVDSPVPWVLSGKSEQALRDQAARLHAHVSANPELGVAEIGHVLATGRTHFEHRAAVVGQDRETFLTGMHALAEGGTGAGLVTPGTPVRDSGKTVFVFPGQGSQWPGMARELLHSSPVFAQHLHACADALAPHTDWSLIDVLTRPEEHAETLERVEVIQPVLFAVMVSLARLWQHHGIQPDAVIGHSQGEIAAAHIAGALTLDDAAKTVALRSRALVALAGTGTMASIPLPATDVDLTDWGERITIAAHNGPNSTVIAGETAAVEEYVTACRTEGIRARTIPVDYASHSPHVEPIREHILTELADLTPTTSTVPFYSTVTGALHQTDRLNADYWYTNLRSTVRFHDTLTALNADGHQVYIETSPHPVLTTAIQDTLEELDTQATITGTLRRDHHSPTQFLTALTTTWTQNSNTTPTCTLSLPQLRYSTPKPQLR
ncbi:polyketide synthase [Streptomyces armeniacus]|uniref:Polyketide synthase n=2 Tax=Streptomyces armeniacus TaxID=83291 RepID=A0A345XXX1_9ACTN|nr:polyketide synthase [Streptomyces armeniacus]